MKADPWVDERDLEFCVLVWVFGWGLGSGKKERVRVFICIFVT
jgi:hypothetical protein